MSLTEDIDKDYRKSFSYLMSALCGLLVGICILYDYTAINHTNAIGRHCLAWSSSIIALTEYFVKPISDTVMLHIILLIVKVLLIIATFHLWKIPYTCVKLVACLACRIASAGSRSLFHKGINWCEAGLMLLIYAVAFISCVTSDIGVFPGIMLNEIQHDITEALNPMWDFIVDWKVYPIQLLLYACSFAVWTLWWTPLLILGSVIVSMTSLFRRNYEPISIRDDGIGCSASADE